MATSMDQVKGFLDEMGLKYGELPNNNDAIITGFRSSNYLNREGEPSLTIVIALEENGEFIKIFAPLMYVYKGGPHAEALMQTLLHISYATKLLQFEYDPKDGEVRAMVEMALEDAPLTKKQLSRCISVVNMLADQYHGMIRDAIDLGKKADEESFLRAEYEMRLSMLRRQKGEIGLEE